jgi:hypothetical protein
LGFNTELQNGQIVHEDHSMKMSELDVNKKYTEVSFMIFRTGSILIVGMCDEKVLYSIYEYLKVLLRKEFHKINQKVNPNEIKVDKNKKKKIRHRTIQITLQTA